MCVVCCGCYLVCLGVGCWWCACFSQVARLCLFLMVLQCLRALRRSWWEVSFLVVGCSRASCSLSSVMVWYGTVVRAAAGGAPGRVVVVKVPSGSMVPSG